MKLNKIIFNCINVCNKNICLIKKYFKRKEKLYGPLEVRTNFMFLEYIYIFSASLLPNCKLKNSYYWDVCF
jgi:hypothetical protein